MPRTGSGALVVPVPAMQPVLDGMRRRAPESVRSGVPAHVTLLYPFPVEPSASARELLREHCAEQPAMPVTFSRLERSGGFVSARPVPDDRLAGLIEWLLGQWPDVVPYEGRFGVRVPAHVTVAMDLAAEVPLDWADELLPVRTVLSEVWWVVFEERWRPAGRFPLGGEAIGDG